MIKEITSSENKIVKEKAKLSKPAYRKETNTFKVDGFHMFEMARDSKQLVELFTLKPIKDLDSSINQYIVNERVLKTLATTMTPQGVVSICKIREEQEIKSNKVLYLDGVSDPGNLGTILRTALAFGYTDVIVTENCCSVYNEKCLQATQGAIFNLNIVSNKNLEDLKKKGYKILATEIKGSVSLKKVQKFDKFVLVLGNEAHGVRDEVLKLADERIRIDIENIESLNVAIAGAIAMYTLG